MGIEPQAYTPDLLVKSDLIVDAILGTGLDRVVTAEWADMIAAINASTKPVLAVDIPSGLNADTGVCMGIAVQADVTISFIGRNQGLYTTDGPDCCGFVVFDSLGCTEDAYASIADPCYLLDPHIPVFEPRKLNSHKGSYGHVLIIGGNTGMEGAARLAGEAALRCGAGLVSIACGSEKREIISGGVAELMVLTQPVDIEARINQASVLAVGPGLGVSHSSDDWIASVMQLAIESAKPLVFDADALNYLAQHPVRLENCILTPHPGEAGRLLGVSIDVIQQDRFAAVQAIQHKYGGVVILKGCGSLVFDGEHTCISPVGNPGMATAGMGDVLTGVIAALIGQYSNLSLMQIAQAAVLLHGQAGDRAAVQGMNGMMASDLMPILREFIDGQ